MSRDEQEKVTGWKAGPFAQPARERAMRALAEIAREEPGIVQATAVARVARELSLPDHAVTTAARWAQHEGLIRRERVPGRRDVRYQLYPPGQDGGKKGE